MTGRLVLGWMLSGALVLGCDEGERETESAEPTVEERAEHAEPEVEAVEPFDLLPTAAEALAVSSTTPSLRSGPRFLVDGSMETPWASRTGDDAAFVEVRVPAGSEVHAVALTSGFTKVDGDMDLFTMNLRIAKVRLLADGEEVGRWHVDTESRELQRFELDAPTAGREWKLEILETIPGTRRGWREVCISELRLFGTSPVTEGAGLALLTGGLDGLRIDAISQARIDLGNAPTERPASIDDWWTRVTVGLRAYPMRCAFPRVRRQLAEAVTAVRVAEDATLDAQVTLDEVACPGEGLSDEAYDEIGDIRTQARDALADSEWDREDAQDRALVLLDEWFFHCEQKLRGEEQEVFRDWGLPLLEGPFVAP